MSPSSPKSAVVLVSGGLDSAVSLAVAKADGFVCHALSFEYGQRHRHELTAAARVAAQVGAVEHRTVSVDLRAIGGSALTADIAVPKGRSENQIASGIPITYVPARNMIFLSIAIAYAEVIGAEDIYIGVNAVDYSGYPDCRRPFIDAMERAAMLGTKAGVKGSKLNVRAPLEQMSKAEIIRLGESYGVDFSITSSCYDPSPDGLACGRCDSCLIRTRGFAEAGIDDPTKYEQAGTGA